MVDNQDSELGQIKELPLNQIVANPYQPRRQFQEEEVKALAESISAVGLIHPPLVRPLPDSNLYELISGERRFRAVQWLNLPTITVYIRRATACISAQAALIENIQRVDLNPLEIAKALKSLMVEFSFNQDSLALKVGKKRSTVANYLRLLTLPNVLQESLAQGFITMGHAKAILSLDKEDRQLLLHELILRDRLNVREAETAAIRLGKTAPALTSSSRDVHIEYLEKKIRERFGSNVSIRSSGSAGSVIIDYYNLSDLDRILAILGIEEEF